MRMLLILLLLALTGCTTVPLQALGGLAATFAVHEYAHKAALDALGASDTKIYLYPHKDTEDQWQLAHVRYSGIDGSREQLGRFAGPGGSFLQSVIFRGALRSGHVPKGIQPLFGWLDIGGRLMSYYHATMGVARFRQTDLSTGDLWVPIAFLVANIIYDIGSFVLSNDTFTRYFGVLIGRDFYD